MSSGTISCILRFHDFSRLDILKVALRSLGEQSYGPIELVLVTQNLNEDVKGQLEALAEKLFCPSRPERRLCLIDIPNPEKRDLRSQALNRGLEAATGDYLSFLDFDDVVESDAYEFLISQLKAHPDCVLSSGKCVVEFGRIEGESFRARDQLEPFSWGSSMAHFYRENFLPIHSFVLRRSAIDPAYLSFDESMDLSEDYAFLLRIASNYRFDFSGHHKIVARYRSYEGLESSNPSLASTGQAKTHEERKRRAEEKIERLKKSLPAHLTISEVARLVPTQIRISPLRRAVTEKLGHYPVLREKVVWVAGMFGIKPRRF